MSPAYDRIIGQRIQTTPSIDGDRFRTRNCSTETDEASGGIIVDFKTGYLRSASTIAVMRRIDPDNRAIQYSRAFPSPFHASTATDQIVLVA